jgi:hypothetical protein
VTTSRRAALALLPLVLASCVRVRHVPALPDEAFVARLSLLSPPASVAPLARFEVPLVVENRSPVAWPRTTWTSAGKLLNVSYHWTAGDGSMAVHDGVRTPVRKALGPGESTRMSVTVEAPPRPGAYVLEVDLVQEGVGWFGEHGSPVARTAIRVEGQTVTP